VFNFLESQPYPLAADQGDQTGRIFDFGALKKSFGAIFSPNSFGHPAVDAKILVQPQFVERHFIERHYIEPQFIEFSKRDTSSNPSLSNFYNIEPQFVEPNRTLI
jgi:hypothetical protein